MEKKESVEPITLQRALGVLFIAYKLNGTIDWHWAWVTLPLWSGIPLAGCMMAWDSLKTWVRRKDKK